MVVICQLFVSVFLPPLAGIILQYRDYDDEDADSLSDLEAHKVCAAAASL